MASQDKQATLERTLGVREALTIGVGTMVGAGIFVFPGLAGAEAGLGGAISFAIGGVIAMLVALATSELATAMPRSGGGYVFVSRSLGAPFGSVVGLGLWCGLIFASAFYLVGFGLYVGDMLGRLGLDLGKNPWWLGTALGVILTAVNVVGTRSAGQLQNVMVGLLLLVLTPFLSWGLLHTFGFDDQVAALPSQLAPMGWWPVITASALVFTSYLGFAQIANVAGEIREPAKSLPRSMMGSVAIATTLYVVMLVVTTSVFEPGRLEQLGETATVEVAAELMGPVGAFAIVFAGVLATLSSANASLMSSSRSLFALARDEILPGAVTSLSDRYGTPYRAILITGGLIVALTTLGQVELLAQVASALHLILYALMCVTVLVLRRADFEWYQPTFRAPLAPVTCTLGALACVGVLVVMEPMTLWITGGVSAAALVWYGVWARDVSLRGEFTRTQDKLEVDMTILLLLRMPDPKMPQDELIQLLEGKRVVMVGAYEVPEQTSPEQAREEYEEEANELLDECEQRLEALDKFAERKLIFTGVEEQTIARLRDELDFEVILVPGATERADTFTAVVTEGTDVDRLFEHLEQLISEPGRLELLVDPVRLEDDDEERRAQAERELEERAEGLALEEFGVIWWSLQGAELDELGEKASGDLLVLEASGQAWGERSDDWLRELHEVYEGNLLVMSQ